MLTHPHMMQPHHIEIKINNSVIDDVQQARFLGVIIDNKLRWHAHIEDIKNKISKVTGVIYKINSCNNYCQKSIYLSLAYP